jgi:hypothetical protein
MDFEFSNFAIVEFLFYAVILFFFLRIIKIVVPVLLERKNYRKNLGKHYPLIELFAWFLFFAWAIRHFLENNRLYAFGLFIALVVIIFLVLWFSKDFIAGIIFKVNERFSVNEWVKISDYSGKIVDLGRRTIEIELETGESVFIPYTIAMKEILIKSNPAEMIISHTFSQKTSKKFSLLETIDKIKIAILSLPWSSLKKEPTIKPVAEDKSSFTFEITIYSPEKKYFHKIENSLKDEFK